MFFAEALDLLLYCVQQLGVMVAVGAETIVLISFIVATRDAKIEEAEIRFAKAVHRTILIGIAAIVLSGIAITVMHESLGQDSVVFEPVFLFKWLLIAALIGLYLWQKGKTFSHFIIEGVIGSTWYTLFLVHILAPLTTWSNLVLLYAVLSVGFVAIWSAVVWVTRKRPQTAPVVTKAALPIPPKKPVVTPVALPKAPPIVAVPKPIVVTKPAPAAPLIQMPVLAKSLLPLVSTPVASVVKEAPPPTAPAPTPVVAEEHHSLWLPAIHIMPQTEKDLQSGSHIITIGRKPKTT